MRKYDSIWEYKASLLAAVQIYWALAVPDESISAAAAARRTLLK